jgi:hypothetical protein
MPLVSVQQLYVVFGPGFVLAVFQLDFETFVGTTGDDFADLMENDVFDPPFAAGSDGLADVFEFFVTHHGSGLPCVGGWSRNNLFLRPFHYTMTSGIRLLPAWRSAVSGCLCPDLAPLSEYARPRADKQPWPVLYCSPFLLRPPFFAVFFHVYPNGSPR